MKKNIILLLAFIGWCPSLNASVCVEGSCEGYSTSVSPDCVATIKCSYNDNLIACARYDAYPLSECPEGGVCVQPERWKITGCDSGYTLSTNSSTNEPCCKKDCSGYNLSLARINVYTTYLSCSPGCGDSTTVYKIDSCTEGYELNSDKTACVSSCSGDTTCPTGYSCTECTKDGTTLYTSTGNCDSDYAKGKETQVVTEIDLFSRCYSTTCKTDTTPPILYVDTYIKFDNGGYSIVSCKSTATTRKDINGCITCSSSGSGLIGGGGTVANSCSDCGLYDSIESACFSVPTASRSLYGITTQTCGTNTCYKAILKSAGGTIATCGSL